MLVAKQPLQGIERLCVQRQRTSEFPAASQGHRQIVLADERVDLLIEWADDPPRRTRPGVERVIAGGLILAPQSVSLSVRPVDCAVDRIEPMRSMRRRPMHTVYRSPGFFSGYAETGIERSSAVRMMRDCSATCAAG
jgi:hypothetical protein